MTTRADLDKIRDELESLDISRADIKLKVHLKYVLGKILYRSGSSNYGKAKESFEQALLILDERNEKEFKPEIYMLLGNLYQDLGEFEKSFFYRRRSIELSENIYQKMQVYSNLAGLEIHIGKYEEAYETLGEMKVLYDKYPFRSLRRFLTKTEANFYYECGDYETCIIKFEELIKIENSVNLTAFIWYNYLMEGLQLYYTDSQEYALQKFDIAESFINKRDYYAKLLINQGRALSHLRKNSGSKSAVIEQNLTSIYEHYAHSGLRVFELQVSFYLASFYLRAGQFETAVSYLKKALDRTYEKDLISFLERELPFHRDLFDFAIIESINKPLALHICEKFLGRSLFPWISEKNRQRLRIETVKLTDIKLNPFGKTEVYLRGKLVADDKWIRKKSKILLAYLMSDPHKVHTKDEIMDIFFDDMPADKADAVYHSAIYNIRTALKIYDIKSDKPKRSKDKTYDYNPQYILYEDKTLRLNPDFYYTSDNIEFEKLYNKSMLPALSNEEKISHSIKAIEIYKGDFLPGYYDSWCEELRVKYKNMYIALCEELIKLLEVEIRYEEVIKYSELLLKEDKLNDSTHISIINANAKLGNIKMAKSRFEIMFKIYNEEFGEKPQPKTLAKINSILAEK
jgi:DNA-binding SARP family transcriptional activator